MKTPRPDLAQQVSAARMHVLEMALIAFVEDVLGRVPSDDEILAKSFHVQFSDTPLSTFVKDGQRFVQFFVWDKTHCVAYGFLSERDLVELSIVRVPREEWPGALCAYVEQWRSSSENKEQPGA